MVGSLRSLVVNLATGKMRPHLCDCVKRGLERTLARILSCFIVNLLIILGFLLNFRKSQMR